MSHLKILRGNVSRYLYNSLSCGKQGNQSNLTRVSFNHLLKRGLSSQGVASNVDSKHLYSPWGELVVGNETLTDYVFSDIDLWSDETALTCGSSGRNYDYGMLRLMIERCAGALLEHVGLAPGDRIGLILPNIPEFAVLTYGAISAGIVVTGVNPLYTADEILRQFADCNVKAIATIEMFMPVAQQISKALKDYKGTIWVGGEDDKTQGVFGLKSLLMADHKADMPKVNADDVCLIPYSSGTTGMPKGVMLTHRNLVSNLKQVHCPKLTKYGEEKGKCEVVLSVPPYFHIYGFNCALNYNLTLGYNLVTIPRFTPEDYIKCLVEHEPKTLIVVPSLLAFLGTSPLVKKEHLESIETVMVAAAKTTDSTLEKFFLKCGKTAGEIKMLQGFGMTESSPVITITPYSFPDSKVGTVGQLLAGTEAKIVSITTGESLGPNEPGELLCKGPQVMKGYWNNEAATKDIIDSDGWLHTGDVCYYDDDYYFYVVDRTKDLIKVKGNQVSPTELENIIMEKSEVADVAVIGYPDELAGELPKAFVVLKPNHKLTEKDIYDLVAQKLTKYKHLEGGVVFLDAIPRNAAGKILRNELKALRVKN